MPFNELQRRDSWPPTTVRVHSDSDDTEQTSDAIDDNPFSFFLTSPDDVEGEIDDFFSDEDFDLDAGIETPDSSRSPVREISPSSLQRERLSPAIKEDDEDEEEDYDFGLAMPLSLKDFSDKHLSIRKKHQEQRVKDGLGLSGLGLGITLGQAQLAARGRAKIRLVPSRGARGRGQTRSLSIRRKQSWMEPSPEIFTIDEEKECEEMEEKGLSVSALGTGMAGMQFEEKSKPMDIPKVKKKVHWAF